VNPTWHNLYISFLFEFFSLALSQLKIEPDFSYLATTAQAPPQIQKLPPAQIKSYTLELLRAKLGKNSQRALRTPVVHFPIPTNYPSAQGPRRKRDEDRHIHPTSFFTSGRRRNLFRRILRQMLLSIAKRFCSPVSDASKKTQARRTQNAEGRQR